MFHHPQAWSTDNLSGISESERDITSIAKHWRREAYRIKGRVANLVAAIHGKKQLQVGKSEILQDEIRGILEHLAEEKKFYHSEPAVLRKILAQTMKMEMLWKNKQRSEQKPYSRESLKTLMGMPRSDSEIFFLLEFLHTIGIKKHIIELIVLKKLRIPKVQVHE